MKLALLLLLSIVTLAFGVNNLWTYTSGTQLFDAAPAHFKKLETRVILDPLATPTTYIVCIATLSNQSIVHVQQRRFVVGQTGKEGPELVPFDPSFNTSASYKDIDIVDGADECIFAALSQDMNLTIGSKPPQVNVFDRIEVISRNGTFYVISALDNILDVPRDFFGDIALPSSYSFETAVKKSGNFFIASSFGPTEEAPINLIGTDQTGGDYFFSYRNVTYPTMAIYNESLLLLCAEHPTAGIPCAVHLGDTLGQIVLSNNATSTYFRPKLSKVNDGSDLMFLTTFVSDNTQASQVIEVNILDSNIQITFQKRFTRDSPYLFDASAIDNYLFLTYADATGLKTDVLYWGESVPPFPIPPIAPVAAPVLVPVTETTPKSENIDSTANGGLPGSTIGAIVGSIVGAAVVAGAIVLAVLLTRRKRMKKAQAKKKSAELSPVKEPDTPSSSESSSSSSSVTHYETVAVPDTQSTQLANPSFRDPATAHYSETPLLSQNQTNRSEVPLLAASEIEKRMKIPYKSLVFTYELGAGNFGKVFKGEWYGAEVAIKVSNQVTNTEEFLAEAKLTLGISPHPNLVQTLGVSLDGPNPCIVLGFCGGGSLDRLLKDHDEPLNNDQKRDYALKIAYGLLHLHQNNIVHRDLAARNILLANDGTPKISDFGMSRVVQNASAVGRTKQTIGPLRWMAPENIQNQTYSPKSDVWSYGILVWEIVARQEPHLNADQLLVGARIRDEGYHPSIPSDCDPALKQVMEMCWQKDPKNRPDMEEVVSVLRTNPNS